MTFVKCFSREKVTRQSIIQTEYCLSEMLGTRNVSNCKVFPVSNTLLYILEEVPFYTVSCHSDHNPSADEVECTIFY